MLFHPYRPVKLLGLTIWPQGMIPRHRARLAQSIGNAVGNELVSQETVFDALFETGFFANKVEGFVTSYTSELLSTAYPSLIEALPRGARAPVLDTISALQLRLAEHIASVLKSDQTAQAIETFVDKQVDVLLARRLEETLSADTIGILRSFVEDRYQSFVADERFEAKVHSFVSDRIDDLARTDATLAEMFSPETIDLIKERIDQQVPPIVHHLADIAASKNTRQRIGALIKHEVDDYYDRLSFIKKIFISRERIYFEVDDLVNNNLPRRVEEYLRGEAFAQQATLLLNTTVDSFMQRPLKDLFGQIPSDSFANIKQQAAARFIAM